MTAKQILDSFSETLMQDERILSPRERSLLGSLLQHASGGSMGQNPETQQAVRDVIASAVGETVAQRAFAVLGASILEKILESGAGTSTTSANARPAEIYAGDPQPPGHVPQPPGVKAPPKPIAPREPQPPKHGPHPPASPMKGPGPSDPQPPGPRPPGAPMGVPKDPQPPGHGVATRVVSESVAVADRPADLPARCVVLDEFLAPQELEQLMHFTLEHESDFRTSEVVSPTEEGGVVNYEHRRSRVLMDVGSNQQLIVERIRAALPAVLRRLGMEEFTVADVEAQVTASNDGDYFHFHSDNGSEQVSSRRLTFVYFFHREPRQFEGGDLRLHDARLEGDRYVSQGSYQTIVPRQNQIAFFPCGLMHEITPVRCPSGLFADSRFTLNGWLRR